MVAAAELPLLLLLAPVFLFPTMHRLVGLPLVAVAWLAARATTGRLLPATPLNAALFALLGMVGVSLLVVYNVEVSLGKATGLLYGIALYWAVVRWVRTPRRLEIAVLAFLVAGAGLAVLGLLGTNWFAKFPLFESVTDWLPRVIRGLPGAEEGFHPNAVGGCLVLFIPLQVAALWRAHVDARWSASTANRPRRSHLAGHATLLTLSVGALLLTQSRGAWTGMAVAGLAVASWHSRRTRRVAGVLMILVGIAGALFGPTTLVNLAIGRSGPGMAGNVGGRIELWSRAIYGIEDVPLTGMGFNTFRKVLPVLYPVFLTAPDYDVSHAHSHLLQAALDLGIPGLVAYLATWGLLAAMLARTYRSAQDASVRAVASGIAAGLIAHWSFSMTDAIPLGAKVGVVFWLAAALATSVHRVRPAAANLR